MTSTVLSLARDPKSARQKAQKAKEFVEKRQAETMQLVRNCLNAVK
jgi:hypothetical protein